MGVISAPSSVAEGELIGPIKLTPGDMAVACTKSVDYLFIQSIESNAFVWMADPATIPRYINGMPFFVDGFDYVTKAKFAAVKNNSYKVIFKRVYYNYDATLGYDTISSTQVISSDVITTTE